VDREIKFEELPEKMQNDWAEYLALYKNQKIKILVIKMITVNTNERVIYNILYELEYSLGVGTCSIDKNGRVFGTDFVIMSISDIEELYRLSDKIKNNTLKCEFGCKLKENYVLYALPIYCIIN
jgi:hypothetical protein